MLLAPFGSVGRQARGLSFDGRQQQGPLGYMNMFIGGDVVFGFPNSDKNNSNGKKVPQAKTMRVPPLEAVLEATRVGPAKDAVDQAKKDGPLAKTQTEQSTAEGASSNTSLTVQSKPGADALMARQLEASQAQLNEQARELKQLRRVIRLREAEAGSLSQAVEKAETTARMMRAENIAAQVALQLKDGELKRSYQLLSQSQEELIGLRGTLITTCKELESVQAENNVLKEDLKQVQTQAAQAAPSTEASAAAGVAKVVSEKRALQAAEAVRRAHVQSQAMARVLLELTKSFMADAAADNEQLGLKLDEGVAQQGHATGKMLPTVSASTNQTLAGGSVTALKPHVNGTSSSV